MIRPRFSIALCTYNGAKFLREQLDSIIAQERQPDELIACDDGSRDATVEVLRVFAQTAPFPVQIHVNDVTLRSTKNFEKAIQLCSGDFIAFSDQDDVWHPTKLAKLEERLVYNPDVGAVFSDAEMVDDGLRPLGFRLWESVRFGGAEQRMLRRGRGMDVLLKHNVVTGATMAFRSAFREPLLPFAPEWVHDGWVALLIAARSELDFVDEPLIKYRQHAHQQLGAPKKTLLGRARRLAADPTGYATKSVDAYIADLARFTALSERLAHLRSAPKLLRKIEAKRGHLAARANLPRNRLKRASIILSELRKGNYWKFSNSWSSVIRDLCI